MKGRKSFLSVRGEHGQEGSLLSKPQAFHIRYGSFALHSSIVLSSRRTPVRLHGIQDCGRQQDCFQLKIPMNYTMLQAYNCDRQKPGEKVDHMPAEKQIYRPDYVKHHFVHYSTVTGLSILNKEDILKRGYKWIPGSAFPDPLSRFADEKYEGKQSSSCHISKIINPHTPLAGTNCSSHVTQQGCSDARHNILGDSV